MLSTKLNRDFFAKSSNIVAKSLIGKELVFADKSVIINETEAYIGEDDPACHAKSGRTKRTEVMYDRAGYSYIYLIYGMYHCLNIVTEKKDYPAAILIRGGIISDNKKDIFDKDNNLLATKYLKDKLISGPGKLCRYLGINKDHNYIDISQDNDFYIRDIGITLPFVATPRIGIKLGLDKLWRYNASGK